MISPANTTIPIVVLLPCLKSYHWSVRDSVTQIISQFVAPWPLWNLLNTIGIKYSNLLIDTKLQSSFLNIEFLCSYQIIIFLTVYLWEFMMSHIHFAWFTEKSIPQSWALIALLIASHLFTPLYTSLSLAVWPFLYPP